MRGRVMMGDGREVMIEVMMGDGRESDDGR